MGKNVENEIKLLLKGVIPERESEMKEYLTKYIHYFTRCDDRPGFVIEAGPYGILRFTQRTMDIMWILGFAANQALYIFSTIIATLRKDAEKLDASKLDSVLDQAVEENKYKTLIESVYQLAKINDPTTYDWPSQIPNPINGKPASIEGAATFDLICMSGAYVFLHEMKHIAFCIENNHPDDPYEEELECDMFAREMMLDELESYSKQSGYDLTTLRSKRAMSICLALFYSWLLPPWSHGLVQKVTQVSEVE